MNDRDKLNQLGEKWYNMPEQGNEAVRLALCGEIFLLAHKLFPRQSDAIGLFFEKDWNKYNLDKGDLFGFMSYRLRMRMIDLGREDTGGDDSIDAPVSDEGDTTRGELLPGDTNVDDGELIIDETVLEVMTLMFSLKDRLGSRAGNATKINYFRLFFTDGVVNAIQNDLGVKSFVRRERDLFKVIKVTFLNYFMSSRCSSVKDILYTALKLHGQMVDGQPMEPPKQPLPNDVYTTYLERVEHYSAKASAVSQQRTAYKTFMKEQLLY